MHFSRMNPFYINEPLDKQISYYFIVALLISLPFNIFYSEAILLAFALYTAIRLRKENFKNILSREMFILQGIFFLTMVCTVYSPDKKKAFAYWEIQAAILFLPLLLSATSLDTGRYRGNFLKIFSWVITAAIIFLYACDPASISHNFSRPLDIHPTYLSMYAALSLLYVIQCILRSVSYFKKYIWGIQALVLLSGMIQLGSKSVLLAMIIIMIFIFFTSSLTLKRKLYLSLPALFILLLISVVIINNDSFRKKYINDLFEDFSGKINDPGAIEPRLLRWKAAFTVIKKAPIFGYGTGMEKEVLKQEYFNEKLYNSYGLQLDAHNQYLGFWISYGIAGILLFLYTLYWGLSRAIKLKDPLFMGFMILLITVSISENILDVNKGIMFYAFFFPLFALHKKTK